VVKLTNRFKVISTEEVKTHYSGYHSVLQDTMTGVFYYFIEGAQGKSALTPILDIDGKPLVEKSE